MKKKVGSNNEGWVYIVEKRGIVFRFSLRTWHVHREPESESISKALQRIHEAFQSQREPYRVRTHECSFSFLTQQFSVLNNAKVFFCVVCLCFFVFYTKQWYDVVKSIIRFYWILLDIQLLFPTGGKYNVSCVELSCSYSAKKFYFTP